MKAETTNGRMGEWANGRHTLFVPSAATMLSAGLVILFALAMLVIPGSAGAKVKVLLEVEDPAGDDLGDGDYAYPTDAAFGDGGEADLTRFRIEREDKTVRFTLTFRDLVDPWNVGNRLTFAAIAIDSKKGGLEELAHNAFARLAAPAEYVIYYGGETVELTDAEGNVLDVEIVSRVDMETNALVLEVRCCDIGGKPGKKWKYTVAAGLQDDYGGGGIGDFRLVNAEAGQWRGGGGDDLAINPNVYDVLMPKKTKDLRKIGKDLESQSDVLANYSLEENRLAVLPYVKR